jgi:hypothetical protein
MGVDGFNWAGSTALERPKREVVMAKTAYIKKGGVGGKREGAGRRRVRADGRQTIRMATGPRDRDSYLGALTLIRDHSSVAEFAALGQGGFLPMYRSQDDIPGTCRHCGQDPRPLNRPDNSEPTCCHCGCAYLIDVIAWPGSISHNVSVECGG